MQAAAHGIADQLRHQVDPVTRTRAAAQDVALKFEALFTRTMVQGLRQGTKIGGEGGGLFGDGPGADTYADWFDDHLSASLGKDGHLGVAHVLMREFERWHQIPPAPKTGVRPVNALPAARTAPANQGRKIDVAA